MSPNESKLMLKTLAKEYEKANTAKTSKKSGMPSHGLANANV